MTVYIETSFSHIYIDFKFERLLRALQLLIKIKLDDIVFQIIYQDLLTITKNAGCRPIFFLDLYSTGRLFSFSITLTKKF